MTEPESRNLIQEVSANVDAVLLGLRYLLLSLIILASILNLWTALTIKAFAHLFADALPGKPLPFLSSWVIHGSDFLIFIAVGWPTAGVLLHQLAIKPNVWILASVALLFLIGVQIILTWVGCVTPIFGLIQGMPD